MKNNKIKYVLVVVLLILVAGGLYLKYDYENKLKILNSEVEQAKTTYDTQFTALNTIIENIKQDYQTKINILNKNIEKTESESKEKISELQEELKGISIESGDFSAIIEDVIKGVVSVVTNIGQGSGAIITEDGYLITNYHVIEGASQVAILTHNNAIYPAQLIGSDKINDLAVLKIVSDKTFHELNFANSDKVKIGEKVVAVGNPAGLGFTVTQGIVSQKDRVLFSNSVGLIQTDVPINPGNSGGPLINTNGNIIGITRLKVKGFESIGFALPSNYVKQKAEQIIGKEI